MNKEYSAAVADDVLKINSRLLACPELCVKGREPELRVIEAENYALSVGGKRIRPVLAIEFYRLFSESGSVPDWVYDAAIALEMTHTFSLIHDDMPEMDDDELRRGMPATHVKYGADVGLLAGDGLAIAAYEVLSRLALEGKIPAETAVKLIHILSSGAGNRGMIAGQMLDLWSEKNHGGVDEAFLRKMSNRKTGCLLKASCLFGAVMANAGDEGISRAESYAEKVGLAFQIVDDVLDVTSSEETLGKPVLSDRERGKPTFADILGLEGAMAEAKRLSELAAKELEEYPRSGLLREFALSLAERKK